MTLVQLKYITVIADMGSINEAAKALFLAQPSLSAAVRDLEKELGMEIFRRGSRGVSLTPEGEEFLGYARQVIDQYDLIESRFVKRTGTKEKFGVSAQHYSFAVKAFVELVKKYGMDAYEFDIYETRTSEVLSDVRRFKSELGILYENDFNRQVLGKLIRENNLEFYPLFLCKIYVYLSRNHPLAHREKIRLEELRDYPCLMFDQGANASFYLAEEMLSTFDYKRVIRANDRATMLNLMVGLNGYTLCSGIISQELNGSQYKAVPLDSQEEMIIGYVKRKGMNLTPLGEKYIEEMKKIMDSQL